MKSYVRKVTTATETFKQFFFFNLNVQAELNIVGNFGLFRPKIKPLEKQQPEKNDKISTQPLLLSTHYCVFFSEQTFF